MMTLYKGADAAFSGAALPAGTAILAAYVGVPGKGSTSPDTPHIWTATEWNAYVTRDHVRVLPIYVHNYYDGNPKGDAANAVQAVEALGWAKYKGSEERFIVIDAETFVDYAYFETMGTTIQASGYRVAMYGSASTIHHNPMFGGYWVADYNYSHAPTALPPGVLGIQWKPGGAWDLSVFSQALYEGCGVGPRR